MKRFLLLSIALFAIAFTSLAQVPSYVPSNGLVGWWPFNGNANDESGNGNNLTSNGNVQIVSDRNASMNSAADFSVGTDYYSLPNSASLLINNFPSGTVSFWVKLNSQYVSNHYFGIGNSFMMKQTWGVGEDMFFGLQDGTTKVRMQITGVFPAPSGQDVIGVSSLVIGTWYHIVGVWDGITHSLYLNGVLEGQIPTSAGISNMPNPSYFYFGTCGVGGNTNPSTPSGAYGSMDDIGIWNRALTAAEVQALYTANTCNLAINTQPLNQNANTGASVHFTTASNDPNASYQWQTDLGLGFQNLSNAGQYSGANNDTLIVSNVSNANNNQVFRCIVNAGNCADTSATAIISLCPGITTQPASQTHIQNTNAQFVASSSAPTATYQWQADLGLGFQNISNAGQYSGAKNDTLTVSSVSMSNNNELFRCIINAGNCSDTSQTATLTVSSTNGFANITSANTISLFPNPAQNSINLKVDASLIGNTYVIYNSEGKETQKGKVMSEKNLLDISTFTAGIYLIKLNGVLGKTFSVR